MAECNGSSSYEPSAIVQAFHNIPRVDIDLNQAPDQFGLHASYYEAVIIWVCAPIILCICIFILLSVYYICICCCCCCRQKKQRSKAVNRSCALIISLLIIFSLGMVAASFYSEVELNRDISDTISSGESINNTVEQVLDQVSNYPVSEVTSAINEISTIVNSSQPNQMVLNDLQVIAEANTDIDQAFSDVNQALTDVNTVLSNFVFTESLDDVDLFETVRHWTVIGYLCLAAILLVVMFIIIVCRSPVGVVVLLVFLCIFTFTVWIALGGALGTNIILADVCSDPDAVIANITGTDPQALNITNYYLSCQCDPFAEYKDQVNNAIDDVNAVEARILHFIGNNLTGDDQAMAMEQFRIITDAVDGAEKSVNNITELLLCQPDDGINAYYDEALYSFCTEGFVFMVVQFSLLLGLAISTLVLICCSAFFAGLLSSTKRDADNDHEDIVAFDTEQTISWANRRSSYTEPYVSNGSSYRQAKDEFNTGHQMGLLSIAPPNYTDLHATQTSTRLSPEYDHFEA